MITRKQYPIGQYILTFEWDHDETNVAKQPLNNLYIEGIWNIKDKPEYENFCTGCRVIDDETFVFNTFSGGRYTMKIHNGTVECVSADFVK